MPFPMCILPKPEYSELMESWLGSLVTWFVAPESGNQQVSYLNSDCVVIMACMPLAFVGEELLLRPEGCPELSEELLSPEKEESNR